MGSGRDTQRESDDGRAPDGDSWLDTIQELDRGTRRRYLLLLLAVVSGVATSVILYIESMFEPPAQIDDLTQGAPTDVFVHEYEGGYRAVHGDGEVIDTGRNGWAVLRAAVGAAPEDSTIDVRGGYQADASIEIEKSLRIDGHGATVGLEDGAEFAFEMSGTERYQTELGEAAGMGTNTVELANTDDIEPGDLVLLEEADAEPVLGRGQPPGEPHSVLSVDGSTVTLEDTIVWRDGYETGTSVYVVDPIEITCSGFDMTAPDKSGSYVGIIARDCRNSAFEGLWLDNFGNRGIAVEGCANSRIRDCTVLQSADIEAGDGYGIQIRAGCHDIVVEGCTAKECRHPISITPAGPREVASRSVTVRDCFVSADGSAALNCHGGSAHDVKFNGCMVHTWGHPGVRTGAQKTNVSGCEFRMDDHHAVATRNDGQGMVITVSDTDVYGAGNVVSLNDDSEGEFAPLWRLVHIDGVRAYDCNRFFQLKNGAVDHVGDLVIQNCYWDAVGEAGIRIENRLDGGSIENNVFGNAREDSHIRAVSDDTRIRDLHVSGNRFQQTTGNSPFVRLANATECVVSDNKFEADTSVGLYTEEQDATRNVVKQNTYFGPEASEELIDAADGSVASDNYFVDTS